MISLYEHKNRTKVRNVALPESYGEKAPHLAYTLGIVATASAVKLFDLAHRLSEDISP